MSRPGEAAYRVEPVGGPVEATVRPPGSKSLTNRALVCAALAEGTSVIEGALFADDTEAMLGVLRALGAGVTVAAEDGNGDGDGSGPRLIEVVGTGGALAPGALDLDVRQSGTTSRFVLPLVALGRGRYRLDGSASLRARPMGPVLDGIRALGAGVEHEGEPGRLPVTVVAPGGLAGGTVEVTGDTSSQFLSGLLLSAPYAAGGVRLVLTTRLVGRPFVEMTRAVMAAFGVTTEPAAPGPGPAGPGVAGAAGPGAAGAPESGARGRGGSGPGGHPEVIAVPPGRYRGRRYRVEPDASAASYFLAAAAICGGRVTIEGLGTASLQGDVRLAGLLERMGAEAEMAAERITVSRSGPLRGLGEVDMSDLPDMAQTVAVVATFADRPTRVRGVGFIRGHETDRIASVVRELRRCGIEADEEPDGFLVRPGTPRPARIETYDDHRMAMSFALLGLRVPGIEIAGPGCVAKTFPDYWDVLESLRAN